MVSSFRRWLLYRTTGQISSTIVCKYWEKWKIIDKTPKIILEELKLEKDFSSFAQRWNSYAILVSRETILKIRSLLFSFYTNLILFLFASGLFYYHYYIFNSIEIKLRAVLFGVSILCSFIFSAIALMLYIYGKIITLDDFNMPLGKMGDPFFNKTASTAIILSACTAIAVGIGIPLSFFEPKPGHENLLSFCSAIMVGLFTAIIFFISVWGTHFSMGNTKDRVLNNILNKIRNNHELKKIEFLKIKYSEIKKLSVWPINFTLIINMFLAAALPIILQQIINWLNKLSGQ